MITIKGPVTINHNNYAKVLEEHGVLVKMPFTATGFKSDRIPDRADMNGITSTSGSIPIEQPIPEPEPIVVESAPVIVEKVKEVKKTKKKKSIW
jgi:hypothetical protein